MTTRSSWCLSPCLWSACALLVVISGLGCQDERGAKLRPLPGLTVHDESSDLSFSLEQNPGGAAVKSKGGNTIGSLLVSEKGVSLIDETGRALARVNEKADGYELTDGDGIVVLRARRSHDAVKLFTATGQEMAVAFADRVLVGGEAVTTAHQGGIVVGRAGRRLLRVEGDVPVAAAALLGLHELSPPQRIALLAFAASRD